MAQIDVARHKLAGAKAKVGGAVATATEYETQSVDPGKQSYEQKSLIEKRLLQKLLLIYNRVSCNKLKVNRVCK